MLHSQLTGSTETQTHNLCIQSPMCYQFGHHVSTCLYTDLMLWKLNICDLTAQNSWSEVSFSSCVSCTALSAVCLSLGVSWGASLWSSCRPSGNVYFSHILCISPQRPGIFLAHLLSHNTDIFSWAHLMNCLYSYFHLVPLCILSYQNLCSPGCMLVFLSGLSVLQLSLSTYSHIMALVFYTTVKSFIISVFIIYSIDKMLFFSTAYHGLYCYTHFL